MHDIFSFPEDDPYDWPFIVTHPKPAVALAGQNMTLSCNAVYVPNPDHEYYFLNWLKDGVVRILQLLIFFIHNQYVV